MLVPIRMGTNVATGNQRKCLTVNSTLMAISLSLRASTLRRKQLSHYLNCFNCKNLSKRPRFSRTTALSRRHGETCEKIYV